MREYGKDRTRDGVLMGYKFKGRNNMVPEITTSCLSVGIPKPISLSLILQSLTFRPQSSNRRTKTFQCVETRDVSVVGQTLTVFVV